MKALLLKDWRVNRTPVIASTVILLTTYLIATIAHFSTNQAQAEPLGRTLVAAALVNMFFVCVLAGIFGGNAFAQERLDRSAEFMAMLPVTRRQIVISKLINSAACVLAMWILNGVVIFLCRGALKGPDRADFSSMPVLIAIALTMFSIAWLCSTFLRSAAIAAGIGIFATVAVMMLIGLIISLGHSEHVEGDRLFLTMVYTATALLTLLTFTAGTAYYLVRIEP